MGSFASSLLCLAIVAGPVYAQAPRLRARAAGPAVPANLSARVAGQVARLWGVDSAAVRLEWGVVPVAATFADSVRFRLLGRGDGGWFGVVFESPAGASFAVRVRAGAQDSVAVATRPVRSGETLGPNDVRLELQPRWGPPMRGRPLPAPGWIARRALASGEVITASAAAPPVLVRAGQVVQLEWRRGSVTVGLEGTALNSAALGESVRVRPANGGGARTAVVAGPGRARLDS